MSNRQRSVFYVRLKCPDDDTDDPTKTFLLAFSRYSIALVLTLLTIIKNAFSQASYVCFSGTITWFLQATVIHQVLQCLQLFWQAIFPRVEFWMGRQPLLIQRHGHPALVPGLYWWQLLRGSGQDKEHSHRNLYTTGTNFRDYLKWKNTFDESKLESVGFCGRPRGGVWKLVYQHIVWVHT